MNLHSITLFRPLNHTRTMSLVRSLYTGVLKRTSTFALVAVGGAFAFERIVDVGVDAFWESHNKGKLWKDLKHKYEKED